MLAIPECRETMEKELLCFQGLLLTFRTLQHIGLIGIFRVYHSDLAFVRAVAQSGDNHEGC